MPLSSVPHFGPVRGSLALLCLAGLPLSAWGAAATGGAPSPLSAVALDAPSPLSAPLPASVPRLDLRATLRQTLERSPRLRQAQVRFEQARLDQTNAWVFALPQLDAETELSATQDGSSVPFRLALTETLYDNHEWITRARVASRTEEAARARFTLEREQVLLGTFEAFMDFSLSTHLLANQEEQFRQLEKQHSLLEKQFRQGLKTREDFLRIQSQRTRARIELIELQNQITAARIRILEAVGEDPSTSTLEFQPAAPDFERDPPAPSARARIESLHPAFGTFEPRRESASLELTQSKRRWWPNLNVTGSATWSQPDPWGVNTRPVPGASDGWSTQALVQLEWNLVDWGTRTRNIKRAAQALEGEQAAIDGERQALESEAERNLLDLQRLGEQFRLTHELMQSEEASYTALEENYRLGRISFLDVITGLRDLTSARAQNLRTGFALRKAVARHAYQEGKLHAKLQ